MADWREKLVQTTGAILGGLLKAVSPTGSKIVGEIADAFRREEQERLARIERFNAPRMTGVITKEQIFGDLSAFNKVAPRSAPAADMPAAAHQADAAPSTPVHKATHAGNKI